MGAQTGKPMEVQVEHMDNNNTHNIINYLYFKLHYVDDTNNVPALIAHLICKLKHFTKATERKKTNS